MEPSFQFEPYRLQSEEEVLFRRRYQRPGESSYTPRVIHSASILTLLFLYHIALKSGVSRIVVSLLWMTLIADAFFYILLFLRSIITPRSNKRFVQHSFRIFSAIGTLEPSQMQNMPTPFVYFNQGGTRRVLYSPWEKENPPEQVGRAIVIEEKPDYFVLFTFTPSVALNKDIPHHACDE